MQLVTAWVFLLFTFFARPSECLTIIPSEDELIMPSGSTLQLTCIHTEAITWVIDLTQNLVKDDKSEKRWNITSTYSNNTYTKTFTLKNLKYSDTAYYTCVSLNNINVSQQIYIFVTDKKHLLVIDDSFSIMHFNAEKDKDLIIPCKPTSPHIKVTLTNQNNMHFDFTYSNKMGFKIHSSKRAHIPSVFHCLAEYLDESQEAYFEILMHSSISDIPTPTIELNGNQEKSNVIVGDKVVLKCSVEVDVTVMIRMFWEINSENNDHIKDVDNWNIEDSVHPVYDKDGNVMTKTGYSTLTINRTSKSDEGTYVCFVRDQLENEVSANYTLQVLEHDVNYLDLKILNGNSTIYVKPGSSVATWYVKIDAHPPAAFNWFSPKDEILTTTSKFEVIKTPFGTNVTIKGISVVDNGVYKLVANSGTLYKTLEVTVLVEGEPVVELSLSKTEFNLNDHGLIICSVSSYPRAKVTATFQYCEDYQICDTSPQGNITQLTLNKNCPSDFHCYYTSKFHAKEVGKINCTACNYLGCHHSRVIINITDIPRGFAILKPTLPLLTNESLSLTCGAAAYKYHDKFNWYFQTSVDNEPKLLSNNSEIVISNPVSSAFSHRSVLKIDRLTNDFSGLYSCQAIDFVNKKENVTSLYVDVVDGVAPYFTGNEKNFTKYRLRIGDESVWNCSIVGVPQPIIYWFKNKSRIDHNSSSLHLLRNNRTLKISFVKQNDSGVYTCIGGNKLGTVQAKFKLTVELQAESLVWLWILLACLICIAVVFFFIMVLLLKRVKKEKDLRKQLAEAGLSSFLEGQTESLNPDLGIAEQANLLPYDRKWEFPRHNLQIGKQVGSGAFGVVMKGVAHGIRDNEESTIVAVKMNSDWNNVKELATELKIMAYLGQHLNVVNLLGACTANLHKKELLVIVEYCPYGNLHNYLLKNRNVFVNHLREGEVNPNVYHRFYKTRSVFSTSTDTDANIQSNGTCMTQITSDGANQTVEGTDNPAAVTVDTAIGDDGYLLNKEMEELVKKSEERAPHKNIYTSDLLCYSYQIAKGMEYLASRKVLHGDLAARNILLAENNIVKICDFGLAKNMYDKENYTKSGNPKLPVKWMSIEAIRDRIFSTQSDIWAYGITLWEIFSLSNTPYPGIQMGGDLFNSLLGGYRMDMPPYATIDIYNLMLECWREEPTLRPSFTECSERIGNMLQENVRQRYETLNNPYQELNNKLYQQADYVQMFNQPNYVNVSEGVEAPVPSTPPGYLQMARTPSIHEEEVEMTPMLKGNKPT
ncbi:vascular endothelial growth factor receptor 1 isoform X2 [Cimex lectularius]|uniref:receptor protein-tyrosine kinase n=2 Tax=Cimex lectularius TaxID=79782 RepID=A0A8I6S410_CIMLE|nr:vascular endothelial growth factor receptor 1 isoform X2 [Cimex lectularius]